MSDSPARIEQPSAKTTTGGASTRTKKAAVLAAVLGTSALLTWLLTLVSEHTVAGNSDGATVVLEGQALGHGHVLLHGWELSLDSFWTIDAALNTVVGWIIGLQPLLINLVPALIAALVIVIALYLSRQGTHRGDLVAALFVLAVLALPSRAWSVLYLQGGLHVGTTLWCLIAFALIAPQRLDWRFWLGVVFLALGLLGDLQTVAFGVVPLALAGVTAYLRQRNWRAAVPGFGGALAASLLALIIHVVARGLGGFTTGYTNPSASGPEIDSNLAHIWPYLEAMFGVHSGVFGPSSEPGYLDVLHAVFFAAVLAAVAFGLVSLIAASVGKRVPFQVEAHDSFLDDVLVFGIAGDIVVFVVLPTTVSPAYARYLSAGAIYATILAARYAGRMAARLAPRRAEYSALVGVMAAMIGFFSFGIAKLVDLPHLVRPQGQLASFLASHHLDAGVGAYWSSSIETVDSRGSVIVRPVVATAYGRLVRYAKQSDTGWYSGKSFNFVVYDTSLQDGGVSDTTAKYSFGQTSAIYTVGTYRVLVFAHPFSVSVKGSIGA